MSRTRFLPCSTRGRASRAVGVALVALWCLLSLVGGATQALCLDLGGHCAASDPVPVKSCHDQAPEGSFDAGCGSCIDVAVPEDAAAGCGRSDHDLRAPAAVPLPVAANEAFIAAEGAAATATAPDRSVPLHSCVRSTVLLI